MSSEPKDPQPLPTFQTNIQGSAEPYQMHQFEDPNTGMAIRVEEGIRTGIARFLLVAATEIIPGRTEEILLPLNEWLEENAPKAIGFPPEATVPQFVDLAFQNSKLIENSEIVKKHYLAARHEILERLRAAKAAFEAQAAKPQLVGADGRPAGKTAGKIVVPGG